MRKALLFIALFLAVILSIDIQRTSVPDLFAIEAAVLIAAYVFHVLYRLCFLFRIKSRAEQVYRGAFEYDSLPKLLFSLFPKQVSMHRYDGAVRVVVLFVRRRYAQYHFDSKGLVEIYVGNRETYRTGKSYKIGGNVTWKLVGTVKIRTEGTGKTVFLLTKRPMDVTSSDKTASTYLENGDVFLGDCTVYTKKHFMDEDAFGQ